MSAWEAPELPVWIAIVGVSLTTLATRAGFIVLGTRVRLPSLVDRALGYAPACALAAIMAPDLAYLHGTLALDLHNPRLLAGIVATLVQVALRSLIATIVIGMLAYTALRLLG